MPESTSQRRLTPAVWLATGLGVGLVSPAPGTVGALWGLPWAWWLLSGAAPAWAWLTVPVGILLGVPLCTRAAKDLGGQKDPGAIVWDEITTVPLVFLSLPVLNQLYGQTLIGFVVEADFLPWWILLGFGLHRLFDITKPPPCRQLESLPDGLGVMLDDVVAALYAALALLAVVSSVLLSQYLWWMQHGPPR